jgi:hypothetical protein
MIIRFSVGSPLIDCAPASLVSATSIAEYSPAEVGLPFWNRTINVLSRLAVTSASDDYSANRGAELL